MKTRLSLVYFTRSRSPCTRKSWRVPVLVSRVFSTELIFPLPPPPRFVRSRKVKFSVPKTYRHNLFSFMIINVNKLRLGNKKLTFRALTLHSDERLKLEMSAVHSLTVVNSLYQFVWWSQIIIYPRRHSSTVSLETNILTLVCFKMAAACSCCVNHVGWCSWLFTNQKSAIIEWCQCIENVNSN